MKDAIACGTLQQRFRERLPDVRRLAEDAGLELDWEAILRTRSLREVGAGCGHVLGVGRGGLELAGMAFGNREACGRRVPLLINYRGKGLDAGRWSRCFWPYPKRVA